MTVRSLLSVISAALTLVSGPKSHAQDKLILLTESDRNYRSQTWFYSGAGNELQEDKIKANWDEDRRITSAAHTDKGWFVTMAKDTGIGRQTYHYGKDWPGDWLEEKSAQNYCITTIASNRSKWFIVMSQGTGYTAQKRFGCTNWSENADRIKALWNEDYYITQATYTGDKWYIVMSRDCGYCAQGYLWASTYDRLKEKIKAKWDEDYNVTLIEYGAANISPYIRNTPPRTTWRNPTECFPIRHRTTSTGSGAKTNRSPTSAAGTPNARTPAIRVLRAMQAMPYRNRPATASGHGASHCPTAGTATT